jgi:acyl carrier protein
MKQEVEWPRMNDVLTEKELKIVNEIIGEQLEVRPEQLTPEAHLEQDLRADSLDKVEISMTIEDRFNINAPDAAWDGVDTVGDVYDALANVLRPEAGRQVTNVR